MTSPVPADTNEKADSTHIAHDAQTLHHSDSQENASRLMDDLELLRAERIASNQERDEGSGRSRSKSVNRRHRPVPQPEDEFHTLTTAPQIPQAVPAQQPNAVGKIFKRVRKFPRVIRYFLYAIPIGVVFLTPILLDIYAFPGSDNPVGGPGGLKLLWFGIWLEIVWCGLWASRIIVATMPLWFGWAAKMVGSSNHKKWKDIGRQMEMPTALFLWMLGLIISFKPITDDHRDAGGKWTDGNPPYITWIDVVWKVIIALFVLAASNWAEKIVLQWIATSFHVRTYAARIEQNRLEITFLVRLYEYSKQKLIHDEHDASGGPSGNKTPMRMVQENARQAWTNIGKVAGKVAGDFTGRKVMHSGHPYKVVLELLRNTHSSHILARRIYRTFVREGAETITLTDLKEAFASEEDAETCFGIFDKDLNGDISMEELELVCNEVHLEKKGIAASLKDLDSVVKKLDQVFLFIIFIIAAIVFVSIISGSAASALSTSGTTILGLSWMLQATAQEFLQSIIFVFVKHPFDVGDRVTVYGNTGSLGTGDDYYVQEISLLYTEFKKMEGHIVQAPNSLLNTLFILNQRRSSGLADPIELKLRFGTPASVVEELKARMLEFVLDNKRDYLPRIISEVRTIDEVYSVTLNVIFFHKSNYQNELLRLQRHNKFAAELMHQMTLLGIEGPRKAQPGGARDFPFYYAPAAPPPSYHEQPSASATAGAATGAPFPPEGSVREGSIVSSSGPRHKDSFSAGVGGAAAGASTQYDNASLHRGLSRQSSVEWNNNNNNNYNNTNNNTPPSPDIRRRRAESRARQLDSRLPGFEDVFEGRRDPAAANLARLQILREESRASSPDRVGPALGRTRTMDSQATSATGPRRRGIFGGRPRSATKTDGRSSDAGQSMV